MLSLRISLNESVLTFDVLIVQACTQPMSIGRSSCVAHAGLDPGGCPCHMGVQV